MALRSSNVRICWHCERPMPVRRGGQEYTSCLVCGTWLHRDTKRHVRVFGSCLQAHSKECLGRYGMEVDDG